MKQPFAVRGAFATIVRTTNSPEDCWRQQRLEDEKNYKIISTFPKLTSTSHDADCNVNLVQLYYMWQEDVVGWIGIIDVFVAIQNHDMVTFMSTVSLQGTAGWVDVLKYYGDHNGNEHNRLDASER